MLKHDISASIVDQSADDIEITSDDVTADGDHVKVTMKLLLCEAPQCSDILAIYNSRVRVGELVAKLTDPNKDNSLWRGSLTSKIDADFGVSAGKASVYTGTVIKMIALGLTIFVGSLILFVFAYRVCCNADVKEDRRKGRDTQDRRQKAIQMQRMRRANSIDRGGHRGRVERRGDERGRRDQRDRSQSQSRSRHRDDPRRQPRAAADADADWEEFFNRDGIPYYYNHSTGVTQWPKPSNFR